MINLFGTNHRLQSHGLFYKAVALMIPLCLASCSPSPSAQTNADAQPSTPETNTPMKKYDSPPAMTVDAAKTYTATIETNQGTMTAELFVEDAPMTVNNFVFLAKEGFYDGTIFHRVIPGFMIQGGDPDGDGRGGPGYKFNNEPVKRDYDRGILAMANAGRNTNGSQFFIMHKDYPLPPDYTIFGKLTSGEDVLEKIATTATGAQDRPREEQKMTKVTVEEK